MQHSKIEWLRDPITGKLGYTINPVKGLCPVGCSYCYARRLYKRFKWNPEIRFEGVESVPPSGSKVFVGSTIELFGDWIKPEWMSKIMNGVKNHPEVTFIFLTKRPENLIKWSPFPDNAWVGTSVPRIWDDSPSGRFEACLRISRLGDVKARVKFISFEPLQADIAPAFDFGLDNAFKTYGINWIIIGLQTPHSKRTDPKMAWIQNILVAASNAGNIPVFMKDNLQPLLVGQWSGWKLRQESPSLGGRGK